MSRLSMVVLFLGVACLAGCPKVDPKPAADNSGKGIIGKTTQDIGEFDAGKANQVVSDQKINASDPVTAPLSAYGPMVESIAKTRIVSEIGAFNAIEGRYPTYEEFMEKIIKANNIQLPVLPYKGRYMYDVEKHELVIVRDIEHAAKSKE
ncbi:MAG: hypothetical protein HY290_24585 [Planctomycetia bacterium]|nr:hypothetical protein [Planctomycetia bacterium]